MICLNPYVKPELREDQILFRMRKARIEATYMAPTEVEDSMSHMLHNVPWENPNGTGVSLD